MTSNTEFITLYGNVGAEPEVHPISGQPVEHYHPEAGEMVEKDSPVAARQERTFWLLGNSAEEGEVEIHWFLCIDWEGASVQVRECDWLWVHGYFLDPSSEKEGEARSHREVVVQEIRFQRPIVRIQTP